MSRSSHIPVLLALQIFSRINNHHDYCSLLLGDNIMWFILLALVAKGSLLPGKWPADFNARQSSLHFKERNVLVIITVILTFTCFDSLQYPLCSNGRFKLSSYGTCIQGRSLVTSLVLYEPKQQLFCQAQKAVLSYGVLPICI